MCDAVINEAPNFFCVDKVLFQAHIWLCSRLDQAMPGTTHVEREKLV